MQSIFHWTFFSLLEHHCVQCMCAHICVCNQVATNKLSRLCNFGTVHLSSYCFWMLSTYVAQLFLLWICGVFFLSRFDLVICETHFSFLLYKRRFFESIIKYCIFLVLDGLRTMSQWNAFNYVQLWLICFCFFIEFYLILCSYSQTD